MQLHNIQQYHVQDSFVEFFLLVLDMIVSIVKTAWTKKTWKCCIKQNIDGKHIGKERNKKIDTKLHSNGQGKFKFFPFQVLPH